MELIFNSVETIPVLNASAAFKTDSGKVFKEDVYIVPTIIDKSLSYIPWGSDNNMPYHIINLIESDETLATCQMFNAEVCYGSGLQYNTDSCGGDVKREVEDFLLDNALPSYFLGVCQDFKHLADELCMFDNVPESITRFFDLRPSSFATRHSSNKFGSALAAPSGDFKAFSRELFMSDHDIGDGGHVFRTC